MTVGGMDISTIDPETLMSLYAIVFQDVTLFNNTVMENCLLYTSTPVRKTCSVIFPWK